MTLNQIIYNIRNLIKDSRSDDLKLTDRQLEYIINYVRARLIRQDLEKGRSLSDNVLQALTVSLSGTPLVSNVLPTPLELHQSDAITYVGGADLTSPIQFTTRAQAGWKQHSKYAAKNDMAFLHEGKLHVLGTRAAGPVTVVGIWEDPRAVYEYATPGTAYDGNQEYPISFHMIQPLVELIVTKEINTFTQLKDDYVNDASSEIKK